MQHRETLSSSRRKFLRGSGLTLAGFGLTSLLPTPLIRHAVAGTGASNKRLLFIFLRGGNDGLHTIIPHGDPQYSPQTRPTLYVSPSESIDLNGFASLHPAMSPLADLFDAGELAAVHRVGYPNSTRSHFAGRRVWHNGDPERPFLFEGWLYRYIREHGLAAGASIPAITVQDERPVTLRGNEAFPNIANPDDFGYAIPAEKRAKFAERWRASYQQAESLEPYGDLLSQTGVKLTDTLDKYSSWDQSDWNPLDPDSGESLFPVDVATNPIDPRTGLGRFPQDALDFFRQIKICALSLLESDPGSNDNGTRIAGTQLTGFDRHANQGKLVGHLPDRLGWLAHGIRSLRIALSGAALDNRGYASIWQDTAVATMSEFGRTSEENLGLGTDHGAASCLLVAGGGVAGGVYNCDPATWPSGVMFGVDGRYLEMQTDYRAVFWELLRDHMGADPGAADSVFPGYASLALADHEPGLFAS